MLKTLNDRVFAVYGVTPHAEFKDVYVVLIALFALFAIRFIVSGVNCGGSNPCPSLFTYIIDKFKLAKDKKSYKLAESFWYLCWHVTSLTCTIAVLCEEYGTADNRKWLYYFLKDTKGIWFFSDSLADVTSQTITWPRVTMTPHARLLNLISIGFWLCCCIYIHWETRRSDMRIMQFHHFTTVSLLVINYVYSFHRIGMIVIILHDIPDVLLYFTKCSSYLRNESTVVTAVAFLTYGLSHVVARLVLLARYVAYPLIGKMEYSELYGGALRYLWTLPGGILCPCLLVVLTVMNIYWLNLIIGMIRGFAKGEVIEDTREKDD